MLSTSCPHDTKSTLRKLESHIDLTTYDEFILNKESRTKSEDNLSVLSSEYDHCPEIAINDNIVDESASLNSFEFITSASLPAKTDDESSKPQYSKFKRRGSHPMKEFGTFFMNKLNRQFYIMKSKDWLKTRRQLSSKSPVFLLGKTYIFNNGDYTNLMGKKEFLLDFKSRFWFTYRQNFRPLHCSKSVENISISVRTSDCGWGCMVRTGQMILAQGLLVHFLGRNWNIASDGQREKTFHHQIIKWFGDLPKVTSYFSIHQLIRISGFNPGDWFGPYSICNTLTKVFYESKVLEPKLQNLEIYFATERCIYKDEIASLVKTRKGSEISSSKGCKSKSVIILVPLHLGSGQYCSAIYIKVLVKWLRDKSCIGIIGGKPRHAIFIVGYQDQNFIYLDPHILQDIIDFDNISSETYHCNHPLLMPYTDIDPSCAVGFYCKDIDEITLLLGRLQDMSTVYAKTANGTHSPQPVIEVLPGYPQKQSV